MKYKTAYWACNYLVDSIFSSSGSTESTVYYISEIKKLYPFSYQRYWLTRDDADIFYYYDQRHRLKYLYFRKKKFRTVEKLKRLFVHGNSNICPQLDADYPKVVYLDPYISSDFPLNSITTTTDDTSILSAALHE